MKKRFDSYVHEFFSDIDAGEALSRTYGNALKQLAVFFKAKGLKKISRENIIEFREKLKNDGKKSSTIQLYLVAARKFFEWLEDKGYGKNIAARIKGPKTGDQFVKSCLTAAQAAQLLGSIDRSAAIGKRDYALIALMLTTGIRTVEAARANKDDLYKQDAGHVLYIQGKGHDAKDSYVKLTDTVKNALDCWLEAQKGTNAGKTLFSSLSNRRSGKLTTRSISRIVKQRLIAAGLDDSLLSAHSLRHTAATLNLLAGGSLEETQQLLRHKNINTTMRYCHALERAKNRSEARISGAIFSA